MKKFNNNESLQIETLENGILSAIADIRQGFKNFVVYGAKYIDRNGGNSEAIKLYREFVKNSFDDAEWERIRGVWGKKIRASIKFYELHAEAIHNSESLEVIAGIYQNSRYTLADLVKNGKEANERAEAKKSGKKPDKAESKKSDKTESKNLTISEIATIIKLMKNQEFNQLKIELLKADIKISRKTA